MGLSYFSDSPWEVCFLDWHQPNRDGRVVLDSTELKGWGVSGAQGGRETLGTPFSSSQTQSGKHMPCENANPCLPL